MMNDELISQLSELQLKEQAYKRNLDIKYYDKNKRYELFEELKKIKREIELLKFKIRLERTMKNARDKDIS